ncbi:hypothetical protein HLV40_07115 [Chromohalobacter salexigens]|nr:hypothetical protein [Chromohalobacter salexigens]
MSLPSSVQAQAEATAKHFEPAPENPDVDTTTGSAPGEEHRNPQDEPPASDETSPEDKAQAADDPAKHEPKDQDALYWQHRFQVLQGKYNSEMPALRQENSELKQQSADKDRRIAELEQQSTSADNGGVSDDQREKFKAEFGEDLVTFVERMVSQRAPASQADAGNNRELSERLERLESEKQEDAQARFWVNLEHQVPTFREVNNDPKFHEFLAQFDPQTGKQRQQSLTEAQQTLDAKGVADVFQSYLNQAGQAPRTEVPEDQIEPRTTRATSTPQEKAIWSRGDINQFYRDKTSGVYGAEEAERLEADIFAAQREGRVR